MFIKPYFKQNKTTGERYTVYKLCESYRLNGGIHHRIIIGFGRLEDKIILYDLTNTYFEGNMADCKTLGPMVDTLGSQTSLSSRKPIVVIDAGIATGENIAMLRSKGYDYMCISRSSLKEYWADTSATPVLIKDKRDQPIELLKVRAADDDDQYLWVRSHAKVVKEHSMNGLLAQRFEKGIQNIGEGIAKKGGTKNLIKYMNG